MAHMTINAGTDFFTVNASPLKGCDIGRWNALYFIIYNRGTQSARLSDRYARLRYDVGRRNFHDHSRRSIQDRFRGLLEPRTRENPAARNHSRFRLPVPGGARHGMSYRRAWLLVESLKHRFREAVTVASTGGKAGGGMRVTEFGNALIDNYRNWNATSIRWLLDASASSPNGQPAFPVGGQEHPCAPSWIERHDAGAGVFDWLISRPKQTIGKKNLRKSGTCGGLRTWVFS